MLTWLSPLEPRLRHRTFKTTESEIERNPSYQSGDLGADTPVAVNLIARFRVAMKIQGRTGRILDNKDKPRKIKRRGQVLTSRDLSLLVIGSLCGQDGGWNVAIVSYCLGFVA